MSVFKIDDFLNETEPKIELDNETFYLDCSIQALIVFQNASEKFNNSEKKPDDLQEFSEAFLKIILGEKTELFKQKMDKMKLSPKQKKEINEKIAQM